jgi:glycosyltransferase involved in cell wall biosynthesis
MKVFMLGWEFPPFISGGLGTACHGLTKAMSDLGMEVLFVLPKPFQQPSAAMSNVRMLTPLQVKPKTVDATQETTTFTQKDLKNVTFHAMNSSLQPYATPKQYQQQVEQLIQKKATQEQLKTLGGMDEVCHWLNQESLPIGQPAHYGGDMYAEIHRYAASAVRLALQERFDVVHAHDWMTYPAGVAVSAVSGKPLVIHVHSTEYDRSGENVNPMIYDVERRGMHSARRIIAVSHLTRNIIISRYGVTGDKVEVVYNGVERNGDASHYSKIGIRSDEKIVLFLGRITMQKGPEYFLMAARKALEVMDNIKFVMAGSGDMMHRMIEMANQMGIGNKVLFTGFLQGKDVQRVFEMADLYVMPSVSEPFGIAPLEALNYDVPVLISKQSGVAEVLHHVLKVDFWDVAEMANKILAVLKYPPLQLTLREHGNFEVRKLRWSDAAKKCLKIYQETTQGG